MNIHKGSNYFYTAIFQLSLLLLGVTNVVPSGHEHDPKKSYSQEVLSGPYFLGGTGTDESTSFGFDAAGNVYIAGITRSNDFPLVKASQNCGGATDIFVTKLTADHHRILYSTCIGGSGNDVLRGMAVHPNGQIWLTGTTNSPDFPLRNPIQKRLGGVDGFVAKFNASGNLVFCTYIGGNGLDENNAIAVDKGGNAYVTGFTDSWKFPSSRAFGNIKGNAFVIKFSPSGRLVQSIRFGGSGGEAGTGITLDRTGNVYLCGWVSISANSFPITSNAYNRYFNGDTDAFVLKLTPDLSRIIYSTFLGGSLSDKATHIAVATTGKIYVAGTTTSRNFPTKNSIVPPQTTQLLSDIFLTVFNAEGSSLVYSTYYGGSRTDLIESLAVDQDGAAYITGLTTSHDLPLVNTIPGSKGFYAECGADQSSGYLAKISPLGKRLVLSSYFLPSSDCGGYTAKFLRARDSGILFVAGAADFIGVTKGTDAFVLRIATK